MLARPLAILCGVLLACGGDAPSGGARGVVLVVVDTLRADHLPMYGYHRPTAPRLEAFAETATVYTSATSTSPWTVPSHASLFTGLDPFEHGAHRLLEIRGDNVRPLAARFTTLAEVLREEGFATAAFVANGYLDRVHGLDQGFEHWDVARQRGTLRVQAALGWLQARADEPFLLFLNLMETHRPYTVRPGLGFMEDRVDRHPMLLDMLKKQVLPGKQPVPQELRQRVINQYDSAITHVDAALGELFDGLAAARLLDETLVVITSDHGEYFGEHHLVEHGLDVYEAGLHVPLLVRSPGQRHGRRDDVRVSSSEVPGLVARELAPPFAERVGARFPRVPGGGPVLAEQYYAKPRDLTSEWGHRFRGVRRALYDGPWKLLDRGDGEQRLHHVGDDPAEQRDLSVADPERFAAMSERLERRLATAPDPEDLPALPELGKEQLRALRELGYVEDDEAPAP